MSKLAGFCVLLLVCAFVILTQSLSASDEISLTKVRDFASMRRYPVALVFDQKAKWIASVTGEKELVLDQLDGQDGGYSIKLKRHSYTVDFSPDGKRCIVGTYEGILYLVDVARRQIISEFELEGFRRIVNEIRFMPSGDQVVYSTVDGSLSVWKINAVSEKKLTDRKESNTIICMDLTSDGAKLITGSRSGEIVVWDLKTGRAISTWQGDKKRVNAIAFTNDGRSAYSGGEDGTVRCWNLKSKKETAASRQQKEPVLAVAVHPTFGCVAVASNSFVINPEIKVWDQSLKTVLWSQSTPTECVGFSRDGRYMAFGKIDGSVSLWRIRKNKTQGRR